MSTFAWAIAFVLMCFVLGGSAVLCVGLTERGKTMRTLEKERTTRRGMENAWQLEQARTLGSTDQAQLSEVSFVIGPEE